MKKGQYGPLLSDHMYVSIPEAQYASERQFAFFYNGHIKRSVCLRSGVLLLLRN